MSKNTRLTLSVVAGIVATHLIGLVYVCFSWSGDDYSPSRAKDEKEWEKKLREKEKEKESERNEDDGDSSSSSGLEDSDTEESESEEESEKGEGDKEKEKEKEKGEESEDDLGEIISEVDYIEESDSPRKEKEKGEKHKRATSMPQVTMTRGGGSGLRQRQSKKQPVDSKQSSKEESNVTSTSE